MIEEIVSMSKAILKELPIEYLESGEFQPRHNFDPEALTELATSIQSQGIVQPIVVRPKSIINRYEIIAGERRWRAAQQAGLENVPCLIRSVDDEAAAQIALIENTARQDLNPLEEAEGILKLVQLFDYTHEEVAAVIGKSRSDVTNLLRLIKLEPRVKTLIHENKLSKSHAKLLIEVDSQYQYELAKQSIVKNWSTRVLEKAIKQLTEANLNKPPVSKNSADTQRLERQLSDYLGSPVNLTSDKQHAGQLTIKFNNLDELDGILARIGFNDYD